MDKSEFVRRLGSAKAEEYKEEEIKELGNLSINSTLDKDKFKGQTQLIITMEELAELSQ